MVVARSSDSLLPAARFLRAIRMDIFDLAALERDRQAQDLAYLEFLRTPGMSCGLYDLPAGGEDLQRPHEEDEIYIIIEGEARLRVAADDRAVGPGTIVFVPAGSDHRFHAIARDLRALVVFAPAEGSSGGAGSP